MAPSPIRICMFGKRKEIGSVIATQLKPEIEVIYFSQSTETGSEQVARILSGETNVDQLNSIGSGDFSQSPAAFVFGAAFSDFEVEQVHQACSSLAKMPYLRPHQCKATGPPSPVIAADVAAGAKAKLLELQSGGKLGVDGEILF